MAFCNLGLLALLRRCDLVLGVVEVVLDGIVQATILSLACLLCVRVLVELFS